MSLFRKKNPKCTAVVVAAGNSTRMQKDKNAMELGGVPVIIRTLREFEASPFVSEIVLVTKAENIENLASLVKDYSLSKVKKVIAGGATRAESSLNGVLAAERGAKLIAIHDGARPFVTQGIIEDAINAARDYRAAVPIIKSVDTLRTFENGFISGNLDRDTVARIQTPQVFDADLIKGALTFAVSKELPITDDASAAALLGLKIKTVPGDEDNIKLTTPKDMDLAEMILKNRGEL